MAASRHLLVGLFAALPLAAACQLVLNLDQYQKVDGGDDASPDGLVGSDAGSGQDGALPDAFYKPAAWATERMPNPAFDSGTDANFNTVSYQVLKDDGGTPVAVHDATKSGPNRTWLTTSSAATTEQAAEAYCAARTELGKTWRLPTRIELVALIDFTPASPNFIDTSLFNLSQVTLWTSSVYRPYDPDAGLLYWTVDFKAGAVAPSIGSTQSYGALCVLDTSK